MRMVMIAGCALALAATSVGTTLVATTSVAAMPVLALPVPDAPIVRTAGGCGPFYHRNPFGLCVANGYRGGYYRRLPPPCPPFYHRDPDPARPICYPN